MNDAFFRTRAADTHAHQVAAHLAALEPHFSDLSDDGLRALEQAFKHFAATSAEMRALLNQEAANGPHP